MPLHRSFRVRTAGIFLGISFALLFSIRLGAFSGADSGSADPAPAAVEARDTWMNVFQNGRKIGFAHSALTPLDDGYRLTESVFMRLNTLGTTQSIRLSSKATVAPDFTLRTIYFSVSSGPFEIIGEGTVDGNRLRLTMGPEGEGRTTEIPFDQRPYLLSSIVDAVRAGNIQTGETRAFDVFDPGVMGPADVTVRVGGKESITVSDVEYTATRMTLNYKGVTQTAWIAESGEVVLEEGVLGIRLEKTSQTDALFNLPEDGGEDLTQVMAVPIDPPLPDPADLTMLRVRIEGVEDLADLALDGERQELDGRTLTITRESLADLPEAPTDPGPDLADHLAPTPFIESDHPEIVRLADRLTKPDQPLVERAERILEWMAENIEKRPVLSLPDAIDTLKNRAGDCNEHAVLLAALARAAGIPARVEAGLVHHDGRFYYHAWNRLHLGRWITADATFGQMPADVSHIRLVMGAGAEQLNLLRLIGKIRLKLLDTAP